MASRLGQLGGRSKSKDKKAASRANGALGVGRGKGYNDRAALLIGRGRCFHLVQRRADLVPAGLDRIPFTAPPQFSRHTPRGRRTGNGPKPFPPALGAGRQKCDDIRSRTPATLEARRPRCLSAMEMSCEAPFVQRCKKVLRTRVPSLFPRKLPAAMLKFHPCYTLPPLPKATRLRSRYLIRRGSASWSMSHEICSRGSSEPSQPPRTQNTPSVRPVEAWGDADRR